jgi:hypothetical protein
MVKIQGSDKLLYCAKCQSLCESESCSCCGNKKLREVQQNDPVLLTTASEMECDRITALLQDNDIPYEERVSGLESEPSVLFGRYGNANKNIFVPYNKLNTCEQLLGNEATSDISDEDISEEIDRSVQDSMEPADQNKEGTGEAKARRARMFWRATSVVLFILIIWAVVTGADFVAGWLKDLFH